MRLHPLMCVAVVLVLWPAPAHPQPRACLDFPNDPNGPLPRQDIDKNVYRKVPFKRAGRSYYVETFSDLANPSGPSEHCFRWEAVNASGSDLPISTFAWPRADIKVDPLRPGEEYREKNNRREHVRAQRTDNDVYAFENERQRTQSWILAGAPDPAGSDTSAIYRATRTRLVLPGLSQLGAPILEGQIVEITFGGNRAPPPEISQIVGFGRFAVRVVSQLVSRDGVLTVTTQASVNNPERLEARLAFPSLRALEQIRPQQIAAPQEAIRFMGLYQDLRNQFESNRGEWSFSSPIPGNLQEPARVFRVKQPVIVAADGVRHCYLVATYSLVPITLTLDHCW